jgi:hypothetical protein
MAQVTESIRQGRGHRSDQGAIWESMSEKSANFGTYSAIGAASDIYESRREPLDRLAAQLLPTLVRSYGLDALDHSLPRDSAPAAVLVG